MSVYEEADEYCPHCDNHYVIPAETPESEGKMMIEVEAQVADIVDDRVAPKACTGRDAGPKINYRDIEF